MKSSSHVCVRAPPIARGTIYISSSISVYLESEALYVRVKTQNTADMKMVPLRPK